MKYEPSKHHRRSIRLKDYDYSQAGAYFVTLCTQRRECLLDDPVVAGIILDVWCALPLWFPTIALDEFVVMPNHVHLIVWLQPQNVGATASSIAWPTVAPAHDGAIESVGATLAVAQDGAGASGAGLAPTPTEWIVPQATKVNLRPTLGDVIGAFRSLVFTVYLDWIERHVPTRRAKFWQRNYYEHIVRSELELNAIRRYIRDNPLRWELDRDNPDNIRRLPFPITVDDYMPDIAG